MSRALKRAGNRRHGNPTLGHIGRQGLLLGRQLRTSSTFAPTGTRCHQPCHDTFLNQRPLIFRQGCKQLEGKPPVWRRRIYLDPGQDLEADAPLLEVLDDLHEVLHTPPQPVELPYHEYIPYSQNIRVYYFLATSSLTLILV